MDCDVCMSNEERYFKCLSCESVGCLNCLLQYGKPFCMKCEINITQLQLLSFLTKDEIDTSSLGLYWKNMFLTREKERLPLTSEYISYLKEFESYKNQKRFGRYSSMKNFVERDIGEFINTTDKVYTQCSQKNCNGFLLFDCCTLCHTKHCSRCFEILTDVHTCDPSTLETIKTKSKNTKPCPSCLVRIEKSMGCDHMRCTNCGTYFSYSTLRITKKSTNPIADSELLHMPSNSNVCGYNKIRGLPELKYKTGNSLIDKDPYIIQSFYNRNFSEKVKDKYDMTLMKYRIQFLENKVNEKKWIEYIYNTEYTFQRNVSICNIIYQYLSYINVLLTKLNEEKETMEKQKLTKKEINTQIEDLVTNLKMWNKFFVQTSNENGGKILSFKYEDNNDNPCSNF